VIADDIVVKGIAILECVVIVILGKECIIMTVIERKFKGE